MREAISRVLTDEGFSLPSPHARSARDCAEKLLAWISDSDNQVSANIFSKELVSKLEGCFHTTKSMRVQRERMWENYYKLRSKDDFKSMWSKFLHDSIAIQASPIFFQFITDKVMKKMIKLHFPLKSIHSEEEVAPLDYLEANALRYMAGYVVRSLRKKIKDSAHPLKKEVLLCLKDLEEDVGKTA